MRALILLGMVWSGVVGNAGAQAPIEVPLRVEGGRMVVPVETANGTSLDFVLSTGSVVTVLSQSGAARAGDVSGLTLGGLSVPTEGAQTLDDERLTVDGRVFDGMISSNMLNQYDVLVDAPGRRLVLAPVGSKPGWEGVALSDPVRVRVFRGIVLSLDVELNGNRYPAMLELGTPMVVANESAGSETGIEDHGNGTLGLGGATLTDIPVRIMDLEVIRRFSPNGAPFVLVGAPVALECALAISFVRSEIRTCVP